jgi:parvulin-like peptidyl-prolyl isomerase
MLSKQKQGAKSMEQNIMKTQKFKSREQRRIHVSILFYKFSLTCLSLLFALSSTLFADIRDRVVAFVDNDAITLSELEERYVRSLPVTPDITREEVLKTMVNRLLLLREAKKLNLESLHEDALLQEYIDLKIRAFIRVNEAEIVNFYEGHIENFQDKELDMVRDEIENLLIEKALNERLISHINELKEKSCVQIQLDE